MWGERRVIRAGGPLLGAREPPPLPPTRSCCPSPGARTPRHTTAHHGTPQHTTAQHRMRPSNAWPPLLPLLLAASTCASLVRPAPGAGRLQPRRLEPSRATPVTRLPLEAVPSQYQLTITPYFEAEDPYEKYQFQGDVAIRAAVNKDVAETTKTITVHAASSLKFEKADVVVLQYDAEDPTKSTPIPVTSLDRPESEMVTIELQDAVRGDIGVEISYTGQLAEDMDGFYISTYEAAGETRYLAATQFEATSARKAFPCFDEPALKASFSLTVRPPDGYAALFNTDPLPPTTQQQAAAGGSSALRSSAALAAERTEVSFSTTNPMSTYLVAFLVYHEATFNATASDGSERQGPVRVWSRGDFSGQRDFALEVASAALDAYSRLFPDYFLHMNSKMDQVAIPDFSAGAMENWGLVTYRERAVLIDKEESTTESQRSVVTTIAHELAHQWFGDLVGPKFWNVLWLNEGFATYWAYHVDLGSITEGWRLRDQFLAEELTGALEADAAAGTHAMTTGADTTAPFDDITYNKGGSILRMFSNWLGEEEFYKRLNDYLNSHDYGSAEPADLFAALSPEDAELREFMAFWTSTAGYPLINVTRDGSRVHLRQGRYQLAPSDDPQPAAPWPVLVTFNNDSQLGEDSARSVWLLDEEMDVDVGVAEEEPLILNYKWTGFYRVNYDEASWQAIGQQLTADHRAVPRESRAQLLSDAFGLARSGHLPHATALRLSRYLAAERDYLPWAVAFRAFDFLDTALAPTQYYSSFQAYMLDLLEGPYDALRFEVLPDDDHATRLLRVSVLRHACRFGHQQCLRAAEDLAAAAIPDDEAEARRVEPDLRSTAYCMWAQDTDYWQRLWRRYLDTAVATEKVELLSALGCSQDNSTLYQYLTLALNASLVRPQDWATAYAGVYSTPFGLQVAVDFIAKYAEELSEQPSILQKIITGLAGKVVTDDQLEQLRSLSSVEEMAGPVNATLQTAIAAAEQQVSWAEANVPVVGAWLDSQLHPASAAPAPAALPALQLVAVVALALLAAGSRPVW